MIRSVTVVLDRMPEQLDVVERFDQLVLAQRSRAQLDLVAAGPLGPTPTQIPRL